MKFPVITASLIASLALLSDAALSLDGSCRNGEECPAGSCCSSWGFCGSSPAHCGAGMGGGQATIPAPVQTTDDGNNAGATPVQPIGTSSVVTTSIPTTSVATTSVVTTPEVTAVVPTTPATTSAVIVSPTNDNRPNSGEIIFNPLTMLSAIAITVAGYLNH